MTKTAPDATGLKNPYGAYKQFVHLIYLGAIVCIRGGNEPYVQRAAQRLHRSGLSVISVVTEDIDLQKDRDQFLTDMETAIRFLKGAQSLDHAQPQFKAKCAKAERDARALVDSIKGGWADRMYPFIAADNDR